ncbi:DUF4331 family protein [Rubrivirga marina]|uniref:Secretion system C-terminal sorting domain-containing protein n=1 Tax=Rubrivirga marina TaxID=1196024 RepID=A0A271IWA4_9BACT|nr:DUF4331 family protein [Rubrivirga marina]PAP75503.1 hypothetical protein BSZ37_03105 [Rubrivirga marina]
MTPLRTLLMGAAAAGLILTAGLLAPPPSDASSHREAPLIADDPLADNTDVYAFRDPNDDGNVIIVADYIPLSHPEGGPNYNHFGENVRYEIHVKNQTSAGMLGSATDDVTYRFTFDRANEDPSTFFNIRLGAENLNTSYTLEKSTDGGASFQTIVTDGYTPPANIGPRSIESGAGLNTTYEDLTQQAVVTATTGETVFAGPRDDPFFVDLGGVFDLGGIRQQFGTDGTPGEMTNPALARDAVAGYNTHALVLSIPIEMLQKDGMSADDADSILDPNFVIGVWASASRPQFTSLSSDPQNPEPQVSGRYVQVSRLGMPLTNEAIIPIGMKDYWNYTSPYDEDEQEFIQYFANPELGLYMGNGAFGGAVPGLSDDLSIQMNALAGVFGDLDGDGNEGFNFNTNFGEMNDSDGVYDIVEAIVAGDVPLEFVAGSAFDDSVAPLRPLGANSVTALAGDNQPRLVDIFPIFYFGVPNLAPYQLLTGKTGGNPLTEGKPFIHNFLPITQTPDGGLWGGDMLRLNMATPTTDRSSSEFTDWARLGLIRAAAIGLTVPDFANTDLEFIPHMDGFPNGRRLEDDVTGIALQAVGGLVLTAVGVLEDDYTGSDYMGALVTPQTLSELDFVAGPTRNDVALRSDFPYLANPHRGYDYVRDQTTGAPRARFATSGGMGVGAPSGMILDQSFPNPTAGNSTVRFQLPRTATVRVDVYDVQGRRVQTLTDRRYQPGAHDVDWDASGLATGTYLYRLMVDGELVATKRATVVR